MSPQQPSQAHLKDSSNGDKFEMTQPKMVQPMNPLQAPAQTEQTKLNLRGGDRGGMCPGRFCFCIPCPLPCDFCII